MRRTKEEAEQTKKDILEAATRVFSSKGVAKTTLEDIARDAGVTRGAIYWHFRNKKEIFDALYENLHHTVLELILNDLEKDHPNPMQQLEALCVDLLLDLERNQQKQLALRLYYSKCDYSGDLEQFKAMHMRKKEEKTKAFRQYFEKAKKKGTLPANADPTLMTLAVGCYMKGILLEYIDDPSRFDMEKDAKALIHSFFHGLCH